MVSDYGMSSSGPILAKCDNKSAINISKNLVQHSKTKNIAIRHHFVKELVGGKQVDYNSLNMYPQSYNLMIFHLTLGL